MTVALLDGDIIAYRAACSGEDLDDFGPEGSVHLDRPAAYKTADAVIRKWARGAGATGVLVVFSSSDVFRYSVLPSYKYNRTGEKPPLYADVVAHIETNWKTLRKPHLEADDTIGILATRDPKRYVAVSIDKDFDSLPARVFNPDKDAIPRLIRPPMADRSWLMQTLTGDSVDGYKGCPGVGPVNAARVLDEGGFKLPGMWAAVVEQFHEKGLTEDDALVQARVARILRHTDFDIQTREIILWHPKKPERLTAAQITSTGRASPPSRSPAPLSGGGASPSTPPKPHRNSKRGSSPRSRKRALRQVA